MTPERKFSPAMVQSGHTRYESRLVCPGCNESYLHHGEVLIFDREEDAKECHMTSVLDGRVGSRTVENAKSGNPSSRRDGIIILFECEHCDSDIQLALRISQHKGETTIGWSYTPKDQT